MSEFKVQWAEMLKALRLSHHLSKQAMADLMFIDVKTWNKYENGLSAPSIPEFLDLCNELGEDALTMVLKIIYPESYSISPKSEDKEIRDSLFHYVKFVASEKSVRELSFLAFGEHGSNIEPQLQEFTAINHLPLAYRLIIAEQVLSFWKLAEIKGEIINTEHVMPDINSFEKGILKAKEAVRNGLNSYTTSPRIND